MVSNDDSEVEVLEKEDGEEEEEPEAPVDPNEKKFIPDLIHLSR